MNDSQIQSRSKQNGLLPAALFGRADPYVRFLLENKDRLFHLKSWRGNSGDALIWRGTEYLFDGLGLKRTVDPRKAEIILIPGGNQTMWQGNIDTWNQVRSRYPDKAFAVGPITVQMGFTNWDQDIRTPGARVLAVFARDPQSYANLREPCLDAAIVTGLSHDPALCLRDSPWMCELRTALTEDHVLAAFRFDHEGVLMPPPRTRLSSLLLPRPLRRRMDARSRARNFDRRLARAAQYQRSRQPVMVCDASMCQFEYFVDVIRSAAEIHTDRLHCMLFAAMLGKRVFAYPTTYEKLEQVYLHSVKGWAHVDFVSDAEVPEDAGGDGSSARI